MDTNKFGQNCTNKHSLIKSITVDYGNGNVISGLLINVKTNPLSVNICKHVVAHGENEDHLIDFRNVSAITVNYHDGSEECF